MANDGPELFAHSVPGRPQADWEPCEVHGTAVAARTRVFAEAFNAGDWGDVAGQWHDLGKLQPGFQRYIRGLDANGPPHAWVGAVHAIRRDKRLLPVAAAIAAHHGGLANVKRDEAGGVSAGTRFRKC